MKMIKGNKAQKFPFFIIILLKIQKNILQISIEILKHENQIFIDL